MSEVMHTYPVNDGIDHAVEGGDCICGPWPEGLEQEDGSYMWLMVHHALDGREKKEANT